jgi:hypothetical protein
VSDLPHIVPATVTPLSEGGERLLLDWIPQHLSYVEHRGADGVLALDVRDVVALDPLRKPLEMELPLHLV